MYATYIYQPQNRSAHKQHKKLSAKMLIPGPGETVLFWRHVVVTDKRDCGREQIFLPTALKNHGTHVSGCRQYLCRCAVQALMFLLALKLPRLHLHLMAGYAFFPLHS